MKIKFYILFFLIIAETGNALSGSFINGTMVYGGSTRKYVIYVPTIYVTQNKKVPLLVGLHGNGDVASNFSQICMSSIADTANYIAVYPEALPDPILGSNAWHSGAGVSGLFEVNSTVDDVGFINRLMDTVIAKYKIDTARMYVFGFSFGGFMTNKMAASNANRFSAAACVSGERGNYNNSIPAVPVPYLHFHGTADNVITYDGTGGSFPPLGLTPDNTTKFWATQNGCSLTPVIDTMPNLAADGLTFIRYTYNHSSNNNKAILYKVVGGAHSWYDRPANDIDYCQTIWAFFRQYAKSSSSTPGTPTASFTATDSTVCIGSTLTFTSISTSSSGSLDSIRWTILGGTPSTGTTNSITSTFNTVASYIITLKAYKSGNVSTVTKSIRVKSKPTVMVTSPSICSGETAQPVASGATSYTWTGSLASVSNPTTPALTITTTYTVTGITNGCTGIATSTVTVKAKPTVIVTSPSICSGQTAQPIASGAASYTWTGSLTAVSNPITPALTTTTTYTVTGTTNGCTNTAISTVTVNALPATPTITKRNDSLLCSVTNGTSYKWYLNGSLFSTTAVPKLKLTQNGNYTVEAIGTNACVSIQSLSFNAILTSVKNNRLDIQYSIIPNPNNGSFEIRLTAVTNKTYQLRMYNISGQIIISEEMNVKAGQNSQQINVSGIEKGVYFLSLIGDDGISTQNIAIQ